VPLIVEDGTGLPDADSYVSLVDFKAYADAYGLDYSSNSDGEVEQAIRRGTAFIDGTYGSRWPGDAVNGREQTLDWPRVKAEDVAGNDVPSDAVPKEVVTATSQASWRELVAPRSLQPDLARGGAIKRKRSRAEPVESETEYFPGAVAGSTYTEIDDTLAPLIGRQTQGQGTFATAERA
jgi:hypothetical protein